MEWSGVESSVMGYGPGDGAYTAGRWRCACCFQCVLHDRAALVLAVSGLVACEWRGHDECLAASVDVDLECGGSHLTALELHSGGVCKRPAWCPASAIASHAVLHSELWLCSLDVAPCGRRRCIVVTNAAGRELLAFRLHLTCGRMGVRQQAVGRTPGSRLRRQHSTHAQVVRRVRRAVTADQIKAHQTTTNTHTPSKQQPGTTRMHRQRQTSVEWVVCSRWLA